MKGVLDASIFVDVCSSGEEPNFRSLASYPVRAPRVMLNFRPARGARHFYAYFADPTIQKVVSGTE